MTERQESFRQSLKPFAKRWAVTTFAVLITANLVSGISYRSFGALAGASLLLGLLNAFLRPLLLLVSLPLLIWSLGFFLLVINALLLAMVGTLMPGFEVDSFGAAFWGGLLISLISLVTRFFTSPGGRFIVTGGRFPGARSARGRAERPAPRPPRRPPPGDGPVIDV